MVSTDFAIPKGSLILVTGVNGFIASHIVDQLLERGYRVRGTVRDASKNGWLQELFEKRHPTGSLELVSVPDGTKPEVYPEILKDVSGIINTVGVIAFTSDPYEVITPTVGMTLALLNAALSFPSIKRHVFTSSSVAVSFPPSNPGVTLNASMFNDAAVEAAWAPPPYTPERAFTTYAASKVEAERAISKFVSEKQPHFQTNAVLPNTTLGEILDPVHQSGSTSALVKEIHDGEPGFWSGIVQYPQHFVNARDLAQLHVAALLVPDVKQGERLLGYAYPFSQADILAALKKIQPDKQFKPLGPQGDSKDVSEVDNRRSEELVSVMNGGKGWTSLEETVGESVKHLIGK